VSGDAVVVQPIEHGLLVAIVDVLGHGPEANEVAQVIEAWLGRYGSANVAGMIQNLHQHLKGTRGAAAGLCAIDAGLSRLEYVGVGNTVMRRLGGLETRLVSHDGVLGQNMRTPRPQSLQLEPGDLVLLYTDGVSDRFTLTEYPSALQHSPKEVVENVVKRFGKGHDDAACIAVRVEP
jgi:serine phosphatase RsbU (regulator of sigma subunit)